MKNDYYKYIKKTIMIRDICKEMGIPVYTGAVADQCNCPFHEDHNPSMSLYKTDNHAYCHACHRRWDNLDFVGEKLDLDFNECIHWMETRFPALLSEKARLIDKDHDVLPENGYEIAYKTYADMSDNEQKELTAYGAGRGLRDDFLTQSDVFFSTGKKLLNWFCDQEENHIEEQKKLCKSRLLIHQLWQERDVKDHFSDYFAEDGIILTIRNSEHAIVGFAQRALGDRKPKYRFTEKLPKNKTLYRLDEVIRNLSRIKKVQTVDLYLVEGMFDALRLESLGMNAVAVLGSQLTVTQTLELERILKRSDMPISIHICMDNDEAGIKGNVQTLKNLWGRSYFRQTYIKIVVPDGFKDPDDFYRADPKGNMKVYFPFEYLVRFYLPKESATEDLGDTKEAYESLDVEDRILCLSCINHMLTYRMWEDIFSLYHGLENTDYFCREVRAYIGGRPEEVSGERLERTDLYQFQAALQIARTSYDRESLPLDDASWERIQRCADVFFQYFEETLREGNHIKIPLLAINFPKNLNEERMKSIYIHERLILQQYVLDELLRHGSNGYETYIPAVRFSKVNDKLYTTGTGDSDEKAETVSFAYEIDMDTMEGSGGQDHGMFRGYYDCWKAYIGYIRNGILHMDSERIYRVKLDIQKFYDMIPEFVVRNALYPAILNGILADNSKFSFFKGEEKDELPARAKRVVSWMIGELYEPEYYDPETGDRSRKSDPMVGIPQGPNLSAYVANIILFDLDRKVSEIVKERNQLLSDEDGERAVRVRYARYVDDMIIISSDARTLLDLKDTIASCLHELGLSLSPKTDREDGITKEEALEWTIDEKGGLGVSAIFDFPDDTIDSVMDEYEGYDVSDRRSALKLLQSAIQAIEDGESEERTDSKKLLETIFEMREARYNDIVRISELLLIEAKDGWEHETGSLLDQFVAIWETMKQSSPTDSLFWCDGIEILAFLDGCNRILKRKSGTMRHWERFQVWKKTQEAVMSYWKLGNVAKRVESLCEEKKILKKNRWVLRLRLSEIACRAETDQEEWPEDERANEYEWRWLYAGSGQEVRRSDVLPSDERKDRVLSIFHHIVFCLTQVSDQNQFKRVKSILENGFQAIFVRKGLGILGDCLFDWFTDAKTAQSCEEDGAEAGFLTLVNILKDRMKAEIIGNIPGYKKYMFEEPDPRRLEFLPVIPGVGYPGLIAMPQRSGEKGETAIMHRIDFKEEARVVPDLEWETIKSEKGYQTFRTIVEEGSQSLEDFFSNLQNDSLEAQIEIILNLFEELAGMIERLQKEFPGFSVILSKRNVFIRTEDDKNKYQVMPVAFLIPDKDAGSAVLLQEGAETFLLKPLHDSGSFYWQAGYLLKDASNFEALLLECGLTGEANSRLEQVSMMEYTFNRLTGSTLNRGGAQKGIRSYKKSVYRAIDRTRQFLRMRESRRILLEDNAAVDSFISRRMERTVYVYLPSHCSYYAAVWAKDYLRRWFHRLMELVLEGTVKAHEYRVSRRVPKAYLYLADCIGTLADAAAPGENDKEGFQGLRVLECGLRADAALVQLRMQALELIESLSADRREELKKLVEDLPYAGLGLEADQPVTVEGADITKILCNLLDGKNDKKIGRITHIGWLLVIEWLLEFENCSTKPIADGIRSWADKLVRDVDQYEVLKDTGQGKPSNSAKESENFPFEQMGPFFQRWTAAEVEELFELCDTIDQSTGVEVRLQYSEFMSYRVGNRQVTIYLNSRQMKKPHHFLTFSKLKDNLIEVEHRPGRPEEKGFSQSIRRGEVVGVSIVDIRLGELLQGMEGDEDVRESTVEKEKPAQESREPSLPESEKTDDLQASDEMTVNVVTEGEQEFIDQLETWQNNSWRKRIKDFSNYDRIALFQFSAESTYYHPYVEVCKKHCQNLKEHCFSCEEFRRRTLLERVLEICHLMNVEILLLPEYSVRPETVVWLWRVVNKREKGKYQFSIWAGTFRIPMGYTFSSEYPFNIKNRNWYHAAVLPVIMSDEEEIICRRIKKYPSLALAEDINPSPALDDNFHPIAACVRSGPYWDARDDVTELICAEIFAISSPGNMLSFSKEAFKLYNKYSKTKGSQAEFDRKMLLDLTKYGEAIALYRDDRRVWRRSIVLVPACTTRAADYYVLGQANYLGSGTNMVFCNAVNKAAQGGSCFIGQSSWDDYKQLGNKDIGKGETSIYHGLFPGIYKQTSDKKNRGALGTAEQALLICDVLPDLDKRNPNPESMKKSLEVVAHIPILEERMYCRECEASCIYQKEPYMRNIKVEECKESKKATEGYLKRLYEAIKRGDAYTTTADDENPAEIAGILKCLGGKYKSRLLEERGHQYYEGHKLFPRKWQPEAALDWCYIKIDYEEFMYLEESQTDDVRITVPPYNNGKADGENGEGSRVLK